MLEEYFYYGDRLTIEHKFELDGEPYAVCTSGDDGYHTVHRMSDLKKWEDTYSYKHQQEIKEETEKLKAEQEAIKEKIKKEAVESLATRIKLNVAFSDNGDLAPIALQIVKELKKIIEAKPL